LRQISALENEPSSHLIAWEALPVMNAKQIWQSALERIQPKISQAIFNTWFSGTSAVSLQGHVLTVRVRTTFGRAHLENRFHDLVCSILSELIGADAEVRFEVGQAEERLDEALNGTPGANHTATIQSETLEASLEEDSPQEVARPIRQPALMMVAAAQREHVETAQSGRRLSRRPLSYTGPELLPMPDAPVTAPLLAQINSPSGWRDGEAVAPPWYEPQPGERYAMATAVESKAALAAASTEDNQGIEQTRALPALASWDKPASAYSPGSAEASESSGLFGASEGMLNPRYTFSTFIAGKSNRLAHAASQSAADAPGQSYNPLVLYGGVGLGKTHLLHAIGHCGVAAGLNVLYTTSDRFTNEIINAIRFHTTEEFRAKYRQIDILLVDDVQFIAGKESTEEEFFHTFNALHNANKQIVLTSDRPPKAMLTLQDRLRSRFEWGLLADIQPPEYEHRLAILRSKAENLKAEGIDIEIPGAVIEFIATPECASIRELEGSLNRVVAYARLRKESLSISLATEALKLLRTDSRSRALEPVRVLEAVARHYNISVEALCGKQRDREIVWPRQVAMFMMREETPANFKQIAAILGGRDHTTVMHGSGKVREEVSRDERIRREIAALREELHMLANQQKPADE
jgi:chromosomal replication initiator protein